jgi:ectoine hydroxylase-related dioxygenase (phytanoyl-CoA dioxygenase family)
MSVRTVMDRERYERDGFCLIRGVYPGGEVAELAEAAGVLWREGGRHPRTFRHGNVVYRIDVDPALGPSLRFVQWAARVNARCARWRIEPRLLEIVRSLLGSDFKQIVNQMSWKPAGVANGHAFHQDCRFRRPRTAYRELATSYVQTMIAIDEHRVDNGCVLVLPGSHRFGELALDPGGTVLGGRDDVVELEAAGIDFAASVALELEPGDVALWNPFLVHGSGANVSRRDRRAYLNSYVAAAAADRGEWAMRAGRPCELGRPTLVDYEALFERPDPHYPEDVAAV